MTDDQLDPPDTTTVADEVVTGPDSIGIALPREWLQIPVERAEFDTFCSELRRQWAEDNGWDRTTQRRAELLLSRIRRDIVRAGIQFIALYVSSPTDEDRAAAAPVSDDMTADPAADEVLMATCSVGKYTKESLGAKVGLTLGNLTMAFGRKPNAEAEGPGDGAKREYSRIVNIEPPMYHDLPIGKSVRLRRMYELLEPGVLPQRFFGETYMTPVGDDGEECTITHFTTINLQLARVFSELFEAIAGTITEFGEDDPTEFESPWVDTFE